MTAWTAAFHTAAFYRGAIVLAISAGFALSGDDGLRQAYEGVVYRIENAAPGRYEGVNPAQGLQLEFSSNGVRLMHSQGEVAFRLRGFGYGGQLRTPVEAKPAVSGNRLDYKRGDLTEWYVNGSRGLEQGFTLARRPGTPRNSEPLVIALGVSGDLSPAPAAEGDAALLRSSGGVALRYAGLRAWDARGRAMPSKLELNGQEIRLVVEDQRAEYPLTVDPLWTQQAELIAVNGLAGEHFGASAALSGTTAVIGAPSKKIGSNNNAGAAYVFVRNGAVWSLQQELYAPDAATNDFFGNSVAVSGDTVVIGAPYKTIGLKQLQGATYIFVRNGTVWSLQQELLASDGVASDRFGGSVAVSGDTAVIGANGRQSYTGVAYVFVRGGATWSQQTQFALSNGAPADYFGNSVAISGNTAIIGACGRFQTQGAAYVFMRSGAVWSGPHELTASDAATGDGFGCPVSIDGTTLAAGAPDKTIGSNANQGEAYIFVLSGGVWTQQQKLTSSDGAASDFFAVSLSVNGTTAAVGASGKKVGSNAQQGVVYVFASNGASWSQQQELITSDGAANDVFGASSAVSGNTIVAGAVFKTIGANASQGAAYVFTLPIPPPPPHQFNDFAGDGRSGALLYDPSMGQSYTALSNGNGSYQYVPNLFTSHFDVLRTGDYNGDNKADLILYNSQSALAYIGFGNGDGTFNFQSLFWSPSYNFVETGDLNGDGKTDVALYNSTTGTLYTGVSNGAGTFTYQYHLVSQGFSFVRLADFTGDGKADLLLYRAADGLSFLGVGDGAGNFTFHPLTISPGYMVDVGDLNADGKVDLILYNPGNGNAATGISDGMGGFNFHPMLFSPGFTAVRLADHTGDGAADLTLYNKNTGLAYFGTGTGTGTFNFQSLFWSPGYDYVVPQDVDGDGKADVILYNSATGTEYTGISNGNGTFAYTYWYWGIGRTLAR